MGKGCKVGMRERGQKQGDITEFSPFWTGCGGKSRLPSLVKAPEEKESSGLPCELGTRENCNKGSKKLGGAD